MLTPKQAYVNDYPLQKKIKAVNKHLDIAQNFTESSRVCLDIGAHIGVFASEASFRYKMVHSFEPIPSMYKMLEENTNDINNIKAYNYVVSDNDGLVPMLENPRNTESNFVWSEDTAHLHHRKEWINEKGVDIVKMPATSIDSFAFKNVDFIKMDTEGYVLPVLRGMTETLKNNKAVLLIEIFRDIKKISNFLEDFGYDIRRQIADDYFFAKRWDGKIE